MLVAIKNWPGSPSEDFVEEEDGYFRNIGHTWHGGSKILEGWGFVETGKRPAGFSASRVVYRVLHLVAVLEATGQSVVMWRGIISNQAHYLSSVHHRNLKSLLGYCREHNQQILVYEYIPNGSVSSHLYGNVSEFNLYLFWFKLSFAHLLRGITGAACGSREKLEFKQRLSIALGAAKGDPLQNQ
ncbi:hypothetical protein Ancab_003294 [Ancistrocladus abbreviatus]